MKTIHTNEAGKYICAVYLVKVPKALAEHGVTLLRPTAYGRSQTPYGLRVVDGISTWFQLVNNSRQTTPKDLLNVIEKKLELTEADGVEVSAIAAVPYAGQNFNPGSPRQGTKRIATRAPRARVVAAQ